MPSAYLSSESLRNACAIGASVGAAVAACFARYIHPLASCPGASAIIVPRLGGAPAVVCVIAGLVCAVAFGERWIGDIFIAVKTCADTCPVDAAVGGFTVSDAAPDTATVLVTLGVAINAFGAWGAAHDLACTIITGIARWAVKRHLCNSSCR